MFWKRLLEILLLPPSSFLLLLLLGTALRRWWPRFGRVLQVLAVLQLWTLSTPMVGGALLRSLQPYPPLPITGALPAADAIVVLSAEADRDAPEYGGPSVGGMTLQRIRYAAFLHHRTQLPILTSGGRPGNEREPLATSMARVLDQEFGAPVRWQEDRSGDTAENAAFAAVLLKAAGVKTVLLVTSAWHLPRAAAAFRAQGLEVVPAPTGFRGDDHEGLITFLPSWHGLRDSALALHEWVGRAAYALR